MPRLLIISPHFPPINAPDMQRVRMSLPHFTDAGWEVVVLTVDDHEPQAPLEPDLLLTIPPAVRIVRVHAFSRRWTRFLGMNNLGLRTLPFVYNTAGQLLHDEHFDLVYFSTTQFILMPLGRVWRYEFGVPYVIDLQDPWLNEYYSQPGSPRPPGGWKFLFAYATAKLLEGWTLKRSAHVISVSEQYLKTLARRYSWWTPAHGSVLTFGAPDADIALARRKVAEQPPLLPATPSLKIAYAGRLGPDMLPALDTLFAGLARTKDTARPFEIFFYGTSYAPAGIAVATTTALAAKHGITHLVHEHPARIGYLDALRLMLESDLTLLLGSEDKAYSPSKIYPTLLSGRPALAVAPANSVLQRKVEELGGVELITFAAEITPDPDAAAKLHAALAGFAATPQAPFGPPLEKELLLRDYTSAAISARQLQLFNTVIRAHSPALAVASLAEYWPEIFQTPSSPP